MKNDKKIFVPLAVCSVMAFGTYFIGTSCKTTPKSKSETKDAVVGTEGSPRLIYVIEDKTSPQNSLLCVTSCTAATDAVDSSTAARNACKSDPKGITLTEFYGASLGTTGDLQKFIEIDRENGGTGTTPVSPMLREKINSQIDELALHDEPRCLTVN